MEERARSVSRYREQKISASVKVGWGVIIFWVLYLAWQFGRAYGCGS